MSSANTSRADEGASYPVTPQADPGPAPSRGAGPARQPPLLKPMLLPRRPRPAADGSPSMERGSLDDGDGGSNNSNGNDDNSGVVSGSVDDLIADRRSIRPRIDARERLLLHWLEANNVRGAKGLLRLHGWRAVFTVLSEMVEWHTYRTVQFDANGKAYNDGTARYVRRIADRFRNPGAFLNWALQPGNNRRPRYDL